MLHLKTTEAQRQAIFRRLKYEPSEPQADFHFCDLHDTSVRAKHFVGGEQVGKSFSAGKEVMSCFMEGDLYWLAAQSYAMCRKEFEYVVEDALRLDILLDHSFPQEGECRAILSAGIDKQGHPRPVQIRTKSLKDITQIGVESPDGIVICEAAQVSWSAVQRCMTRVAASRGWLVLSGTMEGASTWFSDKTTEWKMYPNLEMARVISAPSWTNLHRYPGGRQDPEILFQESQLPPEVFMERFGAVPCPPSSLVVRWFRPEVHVRDIEFNPDLPVEIGIDPGFHPGAYAVVAVQRRDKSVYVIDEIYVQGKITEDVIIEAQQRPWSKKVTGGTIDIASPENAEVWQRAWKGLGLGRNKVDIDQGIDRLGTFLKLGINGEPQLYVNSTCRGLISEWGGGRSPVFGGGPWLRNMHTGAPMSRNDHASKALIYLLVDKYGYVGDGIGTSHVSYFGRSTRSAQGLHRVRAA